jgi:hypothetical protein
VSAANRGGKRRESDYYPTPDDVAEKTLCCVAHIGSADRILEPSAGSGAFVRACRKFLPNAAITAVEPSSKHWPVLADLGATVGQHSLELHAYSYGHERFDLIVGNPPYSLAEQHVRLCLSLLSPKGSLAFLLRLSFLESAKRAALFRETPLAEVSVFSKRPSFTNDGKTDSAAYAVFVWTDGHRGPPSLKWIT